MTPLQMVIEYAHACYADEMNTDLKDVMKRAQELLQYEEEYTKRNIQQAYEHGYETGVRYLMAKQYDS